MKQLPKVRKDFKTNFKEDQIATLKMNYLHGGDGGGGDGDDDGDVGGNGPWNP